MLKIQFTSPSGIVNVNKKNLFHAVLNLARAALYFILTVCVFIFFFSVSGGIFFGSSRARRFFEVINNNIVYM